jgi:hypothetical protein
MQRALAPSFASGSALLLLSCALVCSGRAYGQTTPPAGEPATPPAGEAPAPSGEATPPTETTPGAADPAAPPPGDFSAPPAGFSSTTEAAVAAPPPAEPAPSVEEEAPPQKGSGLFARGSKRLSLLVGAGSAGNDEYLILGAGFGYYILSHLELGLDYEVWLFGDPTLQRLSPGVRYVLEFGPIKPYVGAFYRHTFISDYQDFDQVGGRLGVYLIPRRGLFAGLGAVYERLLDCSDDSVINCDSVYPEVTVGFAF